MNTAVGLPPFGIPVAQRVPIKQILMKLAAQLEALDMLINNSAPEAMPKHDPKLVGHYRNIFAKLPLLVLIAKRDSVIAQLHVLHDWQDDRVETVTVHSPAIFTSKPESFYQLTLRAEKDRKLHAEAEEDQEEAEQLQVLTADVSHFEPSNAPTFQQVPVMWLLREVEGQLAALLMMGNAECHLEHGSRYQNLFANMPIAVLRMRRDVILEQLKVLHEWKLEGLQNALVQHVEPIAIHDAELKPEDTYHLMMKAHRPLTSKAERLKRKKAAEAAVNDEETEEWEEADVVYHPVHHSSEYDLMLTPE